MKVKDSTSEWYCRTVTSVSLQDLHQRHTEMSATCLVSEDQFLCSICLEVFSEPVALPCGHNFCKKCITQHWDVNIQCQCPMCKDTFDKRLELRVNIFISEMTAQFRKTTLNESSSCVVRRCPKTGEVLCDVCTESKVKALKSCLVCLTSYCETHLELHEKITGMTRHKLIDPVENLEDRMCKKHDRPLELFCKSDDICVCVSCTESDHKLHHVVPFTEEYEAKKTELREMEADIQKMIQERQFKIEEIKESVKLSQEDTEIEAAASVQVFTALVQSVERGLAQLIDTIKEKQKATERQAEGFIKELEEEISELMKRSSEVEQLSHNEDHLHFLQSYSSSLKTAPPTKDWTEVRVHSSYEGTVRRAVAQLEEIISKEVKKLTEDEVKRVQQFAVDVTLDPDTAHAALVLSKRDKQVHHLDSKQNLPDYPTRFSIRAYVVGKQVIYSGRFYYEIQVKGKTKWDLGVASETINRKGKLIPSPQTGLWVVCLREGNEYKACAGPAVSLTLKSQPQKVGVFVDYEEGLVSFYDVDAAALIYSFTGCNFSGKLYPIFGPCRSDNSNFAPLIISPVVRTGPSVRATSFFK